MAVQGNLFDNIPPRFSEEMFEKLLGSGSFTLERILSKGHATPAGEWYVQERTEWVVLLRGSAGLLFEGDAEIMTLKAGDFVLIPPHTRHRVEWTSEDETAVWLALHYE